MMFLYSAPCHPPVPLHEETETKIQGTRNRVRLRTPGDISA
jgi:hypothetical protein